MGIFHSRVAVAAGPEGPFRELDALVDTGSLYSWAPRSLLHELGVTPTATRRFVLANGVRIDRDIAEVVVRLDGLALHTICVFGEEGTEPILGVVTLEQFALAADPVNQRLVPMEKLPALVLSVRPELVEGRARWFHRLTMGGPECFRQRRVT